MSGATPVAHGRVPRGTVPTAALLAAAAVLGAVAETASGGTPAEVLADLLTGWVLVACGAAAWLRGAPRGGAALLAATGLTWFAGNFDAVALYWHRGPLVHLLLAVPDGRPASRTATAGVAAGYVAAVVPAVWSHDGSALVLAGLLVAAAAAGRHGLRGPARRAHATSPAAAIAGVLAAGSLARLAFPAGDADDLALLAYELVLAATGIVLARALVLRAWERPPLTDLVVELGERRTASLRAALADALGDPRLEVGYPSGTGGALVDAAGRELAPPDGRAVTPVERDGHLLAVLVHDAGVERDPALLDAVAASARMAAANAALNAAVRTHERELEASRQRLLEAGDGERRRLAQRLRDGAQRRVGALAATVEQAGADPAATGELALRLERARELLARTAADLDALGRGLHPPPLTEHGFAGALRELAAASPVPVEVRGDAPALDPATAATAYFVCAEALANAAKHAHATRVAVTLEATPHGLRAEVRDDGDGGADACRGSGLRGVLDRAQAAGGSLRIDSAPGAGTSLRLELPRPWPGSTDPADQRGIQA